MADWALSNCEIQEYSAGTASHGTANGKGAYVQLIASTGFAYSAFSVQLTGEGGGGQCYLVDIAIGAAGSEQVIVSNILLDTTRAIGMNDINITLPIAIAAGSRISARCQEPGGAGTRNVGVVLSGRSGGVNYGPASVGAATTYGAVTASTNGTLIDQGASANAWGAWTQMSASTAVYHNMLIAVMGTDQQAANFGGTYLFQIGIGAAASEVAIAQFRSSTNTNGTRMQNNSYYTNTQIPPGTRLSMRAQCTLAAASDRHATAILLGF